MMELNFTWDAKHQYVELIFHDSMIQMLFYLFVCARTHMLTRAYTHVRADVLNKNILRQGIFSS